MTIDNKPIEANGGSTPTPPEGTADSSSPTDCQTADHKVPAPVSSTKTTPTKDEKKKSKKEQKPRQTKKRVIPDKVFKLNPTTVEVRETGRPMLTYQRCLKGLGIKYRDHAFLGVQVNRNDRQGWINNASGFEQFDLPTSVGYGLHHK